MKTEEIEQLAARMALKEYPEQLYPVHGAEGKTHGDDNQEARDAYQKALMLTLPLLFRAVKSIEGDINVWSDPWGFVNRNDNKQLVTEINSLGT
jgi:hypothetical protein